MDYNSIQTYLSPGEKLLWSGSPRRKLRFEQKHFPLLFLIPFFLFFLSIPIAGIFETDTSDQSKANQEQTQGGIANANTETFKPQKPESLAHKIIFCMGSFLIVGGFFAFMAMNMDVNFGNTFRKDVLYGITDQRVIVVSGKRHKTVHSIHVGTLSDIRMKEWPDGLGKISFGPDQGWPSTASARNPDTALENITEPRKVFQIILQARKTS